MSDLIINGINIPLGTQKVVKLPVSRLPSGTEIDIEAHVFRSKEPGETMLVLGGVHGDEINGVEIVRRTIANSYFDNLQKGTVIAIPLLNVYGFINFSREVPDGKDVNRSFPGSAKGSLAARVAHTVTKHILPVIDFGLDFHTGGQSVYNYPQIRYSMGDKSAKALAELFAPPIILANKPIGRSLRKTALDKGKPILVFEGGENLRFDQFSIDEGLLGIERILVAKGMKNKEIAAGKSQHFHQHTWQRADRAGIFRWLKSSGEYVKSGEKIGVICDPYGQDEITMRAKQAGFIVGHDNAPVVSQGDALFHIVF